MLSIFESHVARAYFFVKIILNNVFFSGSRLRTVRLRPKISRVPGIAAQLKRDQVILFIITRIS